MMHGAWVQFWSVFRWAGSCAGLLFRLGAVCVSAARTAADRFTGTDPARLWRIGALAALDRARFGVVGWLGGAPIGAGPGDVCSMLAEVIRLAGSPAGENPSGFSRFLYNFGHNGNK